MKFHFLLYVILLLIFNPLIAQENGDVDDSLWVFEERFDSEDNENGWLLIKGEPELESKIVPGTGLYMRSSISEGFTQTINIPVELNEDIYFEAAIEFVSGDRLTNFGIVFDSNDPYNFNSFSINASGYFSIGGKKDGEEFEVVSKVRSEYIKKGQDQNILNILKVGNKIYYGINDNIVHEEEYHPFKGNRFGLIIFEGKKVINVGYVGVVQGKNNKDNRLQPKRTKPAEPELATPSIPDLDYAIVYIFRKANANCKLCNFNVTINGKYVAKLAENGLLTYKTYNAGTLDMIFEEPFNGWTTTGSIDVELGYEYVIVLKSSMTGITATVTNANDNDFNPEKSTEKKSYYYTDKKNDEARTERSSQRKGVGTGTGFAIAAPGYIATCEHVVRGASKITIWGVDGDFTTSYSAKVIKVDSKNDLAIIKIDDPTFQSVGKIPYSIMASTADVGTDIYTLGYPNLDYMGAEVKLTDGLISAKSGFQGDITTYQITAAAQTGNSGGPLFDKNGNIVGVVNAKVTKDENVTYAVKSTLLLNLLESIPNEITLATGTELQGKELPELIKNMRSFVYIIVVE